MDRTKLAARQAVSNTPDLTEGTEGPAQIPWLGATEQQIEIYSTLSCLRRAGVEPNPYVDRYPTTGLADQDLAIALAATLAERTTPPSPEDRVQPNAKLGMRNPLLMLPEETPFGPASGSSPGKVSTTMYGSMWQMMRDMSLAGLSIASHSHTGDLAWFILAAMREEDSDHDQIPKPNDLIEQLTEEDFFAFRGFTLFVLCCHLYGMKGVPVLWDYGGGSRFNLMDVTADCRQHGDPLWATVKRAEVNAQRPAHQHKATLVSEEGWDPWYWVHTKERAERRHATGVLFQRWAVNVWCSEDESDYMQECARRKSLGVAAYGVAIGRYFAALDAALRSCLDVCLTDCIPYVDCCNELDSIWAIDVEAYRDGTWDGTGNADIVYELGRLLALLAGGVRQEFGAMRFRTPDLFGCTKEIPWEARCTWLRQSLEYGFIAEVSRWTRLWRVLGAAASSGDTTSTEEIGAWLQEEGSYQVEVALVKGWLTPDDFEWYLTMQQGGGEDAFFWPLRGGWTVRDLVHQVGFHFFPSLTHQTSPEGEIRTIDDEDVTPGVGEFYGDELVIEDRANVLNSHCIAPLRALNFELNWSLFAMCHPATRPEEPAVLGDSWFEGTNPAYQAGILARRVLYTRAMRYQPDMVLWYTVMADVITADPNERLHQARTETWGLYTATGYRNDVVYPTSRRSSLDDEFLGGYRVSPRPSVPRTSPLAPFSQAEHAWRRRSWFTLRRLVWLLARTQTVEAIYKNSLKSEVVLRLVAESGKSFYDPDAFTTPHEAGALPTYRYAYVAWKDQYSPEHPESFSFTLTGAHGDYLRLALVPTVAYDWNAATVDPRTGYPDIETPDWTDDLVNAAVVIRGDDLVIGLTRADGTTNPAPLCLLTDAEPASSGLVMASRSSHTRSQGQGKPTDLGHEEGEPVQSLPQDLLDPH
ncbi:MAG: hypothetical protein ABIO70_02430 [Pseudomonadota bacterium]